MIRFERVSFQYEPEKKLLQELTFEIPDGSRVCLSAASGKGKTTVFRLLLGLERPSAGKISGMEGKTVSVVFQEDRLIPWKTVLENITLFLPASLPVSEREDRAASMLTELGLKGAERMLPKELSGGMGRRAALARALCHDSDILILDEAFTGLDGETRRICLEITDRYAEHRTLLMTSHDLSDAEALRAKILQL